MDLDDIPNASGAGAGTAYYADRLDRWMADLRAVAAYLEKQPRHGRKVGLLGIPIGAQIASAASTGYVDINTLVLVDGGFPHDHAQRLEALPPLLLIWVSDVQTFPLSLGV